MEIFNATEQKTNRFEYQKPQFFLDFFKEIYIYSFVQTMFIES